MNRKRRQQRKDASSDVGLHNVRLVLASGPYQFGIGCLACLVLPSLLFAGLAILFVCLAVNESDPFFFLGAGLFAAGSALPMLLAYNHWKALNRCGLEQAVIRVNGPSRLSGQILALHITQSKRQPVCVKTMALELFIGRINREPDSRRGWKFSTKSIEYVDPLGKLHRERVPFLTQSVDDSTEMEPVELTLQIEVPRISVRSEQDRKWGVLLTTSTVGDLPDCQVKYYLPNPVSQRIVSGPGRQTCPDCKNEYTQAVGQREDYVEVTEPVEVSSDSRGHDSLPDYESTAKYFRVHRCPHCGAIVRKKETSTSKW